MKHFVIRGSVGEFFKSLFFSSPKEKDGGQSDAIIPINPQSSSRRSSSSSVIPVNTGIQAVSNSSPSATYNSFEPEGSQSSSRLSLSETNVLNGLPPKTYNLAPSVTKKEVLDLIKQSDDRNLALIRSILTAPTSASNSNYLSINQSLANLSRRISVIQENNIRQTDHVYNSISRSFDDITSLDGVTMTNSSFSGTTGTFTGLLTGSLGTFSGNLTVSGDGNFDSGTLYIDSLNNRVGIASSSPSETLSVNGATYFSQISAPSNTTDRLYNTSGDLYWNGNLIGSASVGNWTSSGGNVYRASGNVGIGTTSPGTILSVSGVGNFAGTGSTFYSTLTAPYFTATSTTATSTFAGGLSAAGSSGLTVLQNGNVGISTTSPTYSLDVNGSGRFINTLIAPISDKGGQVANVKAFGAIGDGITNDTVAIQSAINSQSVGGVIYFPSGTYKITSTLTLQKSSRLVGTSMSSPRVGVAEITVIDASAITSSPAISGAGNGVNSSIEDMQIKGPSYSAISSSEIGGSIGVYSGYFAAQFSMKNVYISGFTNSVVLEYNDMVTLNNVYAVDARTHGLVITNSTNVQSFGSLFSNNGRNSSYNPSNIYITGDSYGINFYDSNVDEVGGDGISGSGVFASVYVLSGNDISFNNMRVYSSNNGYGIRLGNGTTNPNRVLISKVRVQPFSVGQGANNTILISGGSGHVLQNVTTDAGTGGDISDVGNGTTQINVNGKYAIGMSGSIGIGTTTPQYILNPYSVSAPQLSLSAGAGLAQWVQRNAGGNLYFATTTVAGNATTSTSALSIIGYNGNIGIGTTNPSRTLSLNGIESVIQLTSAVSGSQYEIVAGGGVGYTSGDFLITNSALGGTGFRIKAGALNNNAIVIDAGKLGIATTSPWRTLSVTGSMAVTALTAGAAGDYAVCINNTTKELTNAGATGCVVSSKRFKENISELDSGLDELMQLKPSKFTYIGQTGEHIGLIAEDVNVIDPRLVEYESDGITPRTVRYIELSALLIKSIQELNVKIDNLSHSSTTTSTVQRATSDVAQDGLFSWVVGKFTSTFGIVFGQDKVVAKNLCAKKSDGSEVCIDGDQLQILLDKNAIIQTSSSASSSSSSSTVETGSSSSSSSSSASSESSSSSSSNSEASSFSSEILSSSSSAESSSESSSLESSSSSEIISSSSSSVETEALSSSSSSL